MSTEKFLIVELPRYPNASYYLDAKTPPSNLINFYP